MSDGVAPSRPLDGNSSGSNTQTEQPSRLPWTTSSGDAAATLPWYGHNAQEPQAGSPFAISSGPTPEQIPGFPFPFLDEDMEDETDYASQQQISTHTTPPNGIKPLSSAHPRQGQVQGPPQTPPAMPQQAPLQSLQNAQHPQATSSASQTPQQPQCFKLPAGVQYNLPTQPNGTISQTTGQLSTGGLPAASTDHLATGYLDPLEVMFHEPRSIQETGINQGLISDLVLKAMYYTSYMSGQEISSSLRLPFYGVIDQVTNLLKKEQLCEVSGAAGLGEAGYQYILTAKGMERAQQVLARSKYVGPAPVPLARYIEAIKVQSSRKPVLNRQVVEGALRGMILTEELLDQVGAAVNAGKSLFLFGAPGNGKTILAERIATMLGGHIAMPYALEADGQIIQLFDLNSHRPVVPAGVHETDSTRAELADRRWVKVHRPVVTVGGELSMPSLDLIYNDTSGFYEAPFQLKANGGLFLIDDFGRQQVSPQALLNRWIVPLEKGLDFLTLKTGKKLQVPFELFLVLSTNLAPEDLIDDAFLRRIQNKLFVPDPTIQQFYDIWVAQCMTMNVPFDQQGFSYLVNRHYTEAKRPFRASQPRDLLRQLLGIARYRNVSPEMTPALVDAACATYFVTKGKLK